MRWQHGRVEVSVVPEPDGQGLRGLAEDQGRVHRGPHGPGSQRAECPRPRQAHRSGPERGLLPVDRQWLRDRGRLHVPQARPPGRRYGHGDDRPANGREGRQARSREGGRGGDHRTGRARYQVLRARRPAHPRYRGLLRDPRIGDVQVYHHLAYDKPNGDDV